MNFFFPSLEPNGIVVFSSINEIILVKKNKITSHFITLNQRWDDQFFVFFFIKKRSNYILISWHYFVEINCGELCLYVIPRVKQIIRKSESLNTGATFSHICNTLINIFCCCSLLNGRLIIKRSSWNRYSLERFTVFNY